jgi:hypothetical protein
MWIGTAIHNQSLYSLLPPEVLYPDPAIQHIYGLMMKMAQGGERITSTKLKLAGIEQKFIDGLLSKAVDDPETVTEELLSAAENGRLFLTYQRDMPKIISDSNLSAREKRAALTMLLNASTRENNEFVPAIDAIYSFKEYADAVSAGEIKLFQFPEAWGEVAKAAVFKPGDVAMLTGYTGDGKTQALIQLAHWLARNGFLVLFVTAETTALSLGGRLITGSTGISSTALLHNGVSSWVLKRVENTFQGLAGNIWFYASYFPTAKSILSAMTNGVMQAQAKGYKQIAVLVDYLQRIDSDGDSERERLSSIVAAIKAWCLSTQDWAPPGINAVIGSQVEELTGKAFGARHIENFSQVVIRIGKREEKCDHDIPVLSTRLDALGNRTPVWVCWEHGIIVKPRSVGGVYRCTNCDRTLDQLYYQKTGGRGAKTTLQLVKNNDGETATQPVLACWFDIANAFLAQEE